jgi:Tfp pilus assembly protein PilX
VIFVGSPTPERGFGLLVWVIVLVILVVLAIAVIRALL